MLCPFPLAEVQPAFETFDFGTKQGRRTRYLRCGSCAPMAVSTLSCTTLLFFLLRRACHAVLCCAWVFGWVWFAPACFLHFSEPTTRMRTAARPAQGRPAITNLKHKTGGRKPHLPRLISACVWPTHRPACSCERTWAANSTCAGRVPGGGYPPARRWTVHVHCSTCLGCPGSRWLTRGMYLEIINRIPARAPDRPVWAYGVLRIQPRPKVCLSSPRLSSIWVLGGPEPPTTYMHIWDGPGHYRGIQYR